MRKSTFNETQIVGILKDTESGVPVPDLLPKYGVRATYAQYPRAVRHCAAHDDRRSTRRLTDALDRCSIV